MKTYEMIKNRRKELKLSQAELGERVGYTQQAIQKIENGERGVDKSKLNIFSEVLGISIQKLLGLNNTQTTSTIDESSALIEHIVTKVCKWIAEEDLEYTPEDEAKLIKLLYMKLSQTPMENRETEIINILDYERMRKVG